MGTLNSKRDLAERLLQLGTQLRQVRQERAISLEHVAAKTMVQQRLLQAIEEGRLEDLPEPVYTQGFIRRYADALGLNGAEFARAFPVETAEQVTTASAQPKPAAPLRPIHLYLLYILVIAAAVSGLSYLLSRRPQPDVVVTPSPTVAPTTPVPTPAATVSAAPTTSPTTAVSPAASPAAGSPAPQATTPAATASPVVTASPQSVASPVPNVPSTTTSPLPGVAPQPTAPPRIASSGVKADLSLKQASWLEIVADGKVVYEGILPAGAKKSWAAKQQLIVRSGNAGGVMVSLNGAAAKPLGKPGAVSETTFKAEPAPPTPAPLTTVPAPTAPAPLAPANP